MTEPEDYYGNYYKNIARIYTELMPPVYSDSIPEENFRCRVPETTGTVPGFDQGPGLRQHAHA